VQYALKPEDFCVSLIKNAHLNRTEKYLLAAAILLLCVCAYVHTVSANSSDKNWLLLAAQKWLSGDQLYTDIFEINPPLIIWLYAIPVWISMHLKLLSAYNALALLTFALIAFVLRLCAGLLARHPGFAGSPKKRLGFILWLTYVFVFLTAPMYFSDREHLLFVLTFPYVLRFIPGLARRRLSLKLRLAIGLLAAIGFCIKPHTLVVFAVLQLLYMLRERSCAILASVENAVIYLLGGLYVAAIVCCMPEYLHTVLPMAFATYSAYSRKVDGIYSIIVFVVIMGITFADFRPRHSSPYRRDVYYFLGVCAAYLAYGLLNNGWAYTYIPLLSIARILAGWVLLEFVWLKQDADARGLLARQFLFGIRSCSVNLLLNVSFYVICFVAYLVPTDCQKSISCSGTALFFREAKQHPAHSFGVMSLEFYKWSELSRETGEHWDTRFNHLWMLPKFLLLGPDFRQKHQWIIDYVGQAYAEDLERHKPDIVYVDSSPELFKGYSHVDLPGYLSSVPAFKTAWSHYRRTDTIDACIKPPKGEPEEAALKSDCRFDIYSRMPL
jgi:hypothetical protein